MNDAEKRRHQLLRQTRGLYQDDGAGIPAVHPRYQAAYKSLYGADTEETSQSTFGIRTLICIMLFAVFVLTDYKGTTVCSLSSQEITQQIQTQSKMIHLLKEIPKP